MPYPTYIPPSGMPSGQSPGVYPGTVDRPGPQPMPGNATAYWAGQQPSQPGYSCRPVTSREEAVAVPVDFLGPGTIMPDFGHGMIYFKRFNPNSGVSEFFDFAVQAPPQAQQTSSAAPAYDPREDIEDLRNDYNALRGELDEIKKAGQKRTGGKAAEQ